MLTRRGGKMTHRGGRVRRSCHPMDKYRHPTLCHNLNKETALLDHDASKVTNRSYRRFATPHRTLRQICIYSSRQKKVNFHYTKGITTATVRATARAREREILTSFFPSPHNYHRQSPPLRNNHIQSAT